MALGAVEMMRFCMQKINLKDGIPIQKSVKKSVIRLEIFFIMAVIVRKVFLYITIVVLRPDLGQVFRPCFKALQYRNFYECRNIVVPQKGCFDKYS